MMQHRQESVDSVGWDTSNQGMGADAYRLPTIQPHTPMSGGFMNSNSNTAAKVNVTGPVTTSSPMQTPRAYEYQPPSGPPPQQLHPPVVDPFSSAENLAPGYNGLSSPSTSSRLGPEFTRTPPPLQPPPPRQQVQPVHVASVPSSPYSSTPHSPVQYAIAYQPPSDPPSGAAPPMLPSPQFSSGPYATTGALTSPHNPYAGSPAPAHTQVASDASAYYTAPHSRVGTEDEMLPSSGHPRTFSPPPPSYHTMQ